MTSATVITMSKDIYDNDNNPTNNSNNDKCIDINDNDNNYNNNDADNSPQSQR